MQSKTRPQDLCQIFLMVGYLGSGKTTFIKNLIKQDKIASQLAIIQNEFSQEMGIESPMIVNSEGTPFKNFLELPNGCICCSAKTDLLAAVEYLSLKGNIKYIVVQTNGVADPAQSIKQFWIDDNMEIPVRLHSIITMVPTHRFKQMKEDAIFKKEIVFCNKVVLGFLDKSSVEQCKQVVEYVKSLNPLAKIYEGTDPAVYQKIFQGDYFETKTLQNINFESNDHQDIQSMVLKFETLPDLKTLEKNVGMLLWETPGMQIMRIKGLIVLGGQQMLHQIQGVDDTFEIKASAVPKSSTLQSKILVIGRNLDKQHLRKAISQG